MVAKGISFLVWVLCLDKVLVNAPRFLFLFSVSLLWCTCNVLIFYCAYSCYPSIFGWNQSISVFCQHMIMWWLWLIYAFQDLAFDLSLSALLGDNIYNFGELLAHPIVSEVLFKFVWLGFCQEHMFNNLQWCVFS